MRKLNSFLIESTSVEQLIAKLSDFGYHKIQMLNKSTIGVYVNTSERVSTLEDLSKKLNTKISMPITGIKSSIGALKIDSGPFQGLSVYVKPDASKSLSTDQQESLHAYFIATKFNKSDTEYSLDDIVKYGTKDVRTKFKPEELYNISSPSWIKSAGLIADTIYSKYAGEKYLVVQRSKSPFVDAITGAFTRINKQSEIKINQDKWNPADIWAVDPKLIKTNFSKFETIDELNNWILVNFKKRDLLPISLKKVGKKAKFEIKNIDKKPVIVKYDGFDFGVKGYVNTLQMNVNYNKGSTIVFRNFGRPENIAGEIKGKGAAGGKVGFGIVLSYFNKYGKGKLKLPIAKTIAASYLKNKNKFLTDLYNQASRIDRKSLNGMSIKNFINDITKKGNELTYVISKYQVTQLAEVLSKMSTLNKNRVLVSLIKYAGSQLDTSAVYIKVSEG